MAEDPSDPTPEKPSVLAGLDPDHRLKEAALGRRRWRMGDTLNASQIYENRGFRLLELLAPGDFYRWPMWKKLFLVIPALILLVLLFVLRTLLLTD